MCFKAGMGLSVDSSSFLDHAQWESGYENAHCETSGKGASRDVEDGSIKACKDKSKYG